MSKRIKMVVAMDVTVSQAIALQIMFDHWNALASMGSSRKVGFFVDGDGNFKPKASCAFSEPLPEITEEMRKAAIMDIDKNGNRTYDFDPIAWIFQREEDEERERLEIAKEIIQDEQESSGQG